MAPRMPAAVAEKAVPMKKRGYVTFLAGDGDYVKGAVGLAKGLRKVKSAYQLVAAVLSDVPEEHRQILRAQGCAVREIEPVYPPENRVQFAMDYYVINYSKLRIWNFEEYSKMIYLDADTQVFRNIDHLFDMPGGNFYAVLDCFCEKTWSHSRQHSVGYCQQCPEKVTWPSEDIVGGPPPPLYFNAGMFLFEPSRLTAAALLQRLESTAPTPFAEQDLLNAYFGKIFKPLPLIYNLVLAMMWRHPENVELGAVKVVHYCAAVPRRVVRGKPMRMRSSLTNELVAVWRVRYNIGAEIEIRTPDDCQRAQTPPEGWITLCESSLRAGVRLPPCAELSAILTYCGAPLSQFVPQAMTRVMGLIVYFREHGSSFSLDLFRDWCGGRLDHGGRVEVFSNKCWLRFAERADRRHGNTLYGFIRNSWGWPELWGPLAEGCSRGRGREQEFSPILGFERPQGLAAELFHVSLPVDEKRLLLCGLSMDLGRAAAVPLDRGRKRKLVFDQLPPPPEDRPADSQHGSRVGGPSGPDPEVEVIGSSAPRPPRVEAPAAPQSKGKRPSSALARYFAQMAVQAQIVVAWNGHYVGLKDQFLTLQEKLTSAKASLSSLTKKREVDQSRLRELEQEVAVGKAELVVLRGEL